MIEYTVRDTEEDIEYSGRCEAVMLFAGGEQADCGEDETVSTCSYMGPVYHPGLVDAITSAAIEEGEERMPYRAFLAGVYTKMKEDGYLISLARALLDDFPDSGEDGGER